MSADTAFGMVNWVALPVWIVWIFAPTSRAARWLSQANFPWIVMSALYAGLLAVGMSSPGASSGDFNSLDGVMAFFDNRWGVVAAWVHYLCFDSFVGRWMTRAAPSAGYRLAPVLVLTLFFGPVGLLCFFGLRRWLGPEPQAA